MRAQLGTLVEIGAYLAFLVGMFLADRIQVAMPLAALAAFVLLRRQGPVAVAVGLTRAHLDRRTVARSVGLGIAVTAVAWWILRPLAELLTDQALDLTELREAVATPAGFAAMLGVAWLGAALGEEWIFRAYPLTRAAGLSRPAQALVALASVVVFGIGHDYQGPAGILLSGSVGALLTAIYWASGRNLWGNVIVHGTVDTLAFVLLRAGWIG